MALVKAGRAIAAGQSGMEAQTGMAWAKRGEKSRMPEAEQGLRPGLDWSMAQEALCQFLFRDFSPNRPTAFCWTRTGCFELWTSALRLASCTNCSLFQHHPSCTRRIETAAC